MARYWPMGCRISTPSLYKLSMKKKKKISSSAAYFLILHGVLWRNALIEKCQIDQEFPDY